MASIFRLLASVLSPADRKNPPPVTKRRSVNTGKANTRTGSNSVSNMTPAPLPSALPSTTPYPVEALPPSLRRAIESIGRVTQAPIAICAQSVLSAVSLSVSRIAKVETLLHGADVFAADYFTTIAESGERKSAADRLAMKGITGVFEERHRQHKRELAMYKEELASCTKGAPKPEMPSFSTFLVTEPTLEGLLSVVPDGRGFVGWFTDEGAQFFGGYSMSKDNRMKTSGGLSKLWDGAFVSQPRASRVGDAIIPPCATTVNLMFQPVLLPDSYGDNFLVKQGLLARVLPTWPESNMGKRRFRKAGAEDLEAVAVFQERTASLIKGSLEMCAEHRVLALSEGAFETCRQFHDEIEGQLGVGGRFADISGFASKAAEHACRIAGILTLFEDGHATSVETETMGAACSLIRFYLSEFEHLRAAALADSAVNQAQEVLNRLLPRVGPGKAFARERLQQYGPSLTRRAAQLNKALDILEQYGWIEPLAPRTVVDGKARRAAYRVNPNAGSSNGRHELKHAA